MWNYRLCKSTYCSEYQGKHYEDITYDIREAYYNMNGEIYAVTEDAVGIVGEDPDSAKQCLAMMRTAFEKEVIDLDNFVFAQADHKLV